jgi:hypothetical protein
MPGGARRGNKQNYRQLELIAMTFVTQVHRRHL